MIGIWSIFYLSYKNLVFIRSLFRDCKIRFINCLVLAVLEELEILKEIEMELEGNSLKRTDSEITLQKSIDEPG